jgi:ketosteroid isomerase-like protein
VSDPRGVLEDFYARWGKAHTERDWGSMMSLYDLEALFFGSTPDLHVGPSDVRAYFEALAPQPDAHVEFELLGATSPAPDVVEGASIATFRWTGNTAGTRIRFTHTLVRRADRWLAVAHHGSPAGPGVVESSTPRQKADQ